jgi:hypothetical protein
VTIYPSRSIEPGFLTSKSGTGPLNCKKDNNHKASSRLNL